MRDGGFHHARGAGSESSAPALTPPHPEHAARRQRGRRRLRAEPGWCVDAAGYCRRSGDERACSERPVLSQVGRPQPERSVRRRVRAARATGSSAQRVILGDREVADSAHHAASGAGYCGDRSFGLLGTARVVVLPGEQVHRATGGVDLVFAAAEVHFIAVVIGVTAIDSWAALGVHPPHLSACGFRALRRHQPVCPGRDRLIAVDVGHQRPVVEAALHFCGTGEADDTTDAIRVSQSQLQHERSGHRASDHNGLLKSQGIDDRDHGRAVKLCSEQVFVLPPTFRWQRLAVPGQIEREMWIGRGPRRPSADGGKDRLQSAPAVCRQTTGMPLPDSSI